MTDFFTEPRLARASEAVLAAGLPKYPIKIIDELPRWVEPPEKAIGVYVPMLDSLWLAPNELYATQVAVAVHEYAHAVMQRAYLGDLGLREKIDRILEACVGTESVHYFVFGQLIAPEKANWNYILDPDEMFARAMAQYVCGYLLPETWKAAMAPDVGLSDVQWEWPDFQAIAKVIHEQFPPRRELVAA
jgi:hypothetical protein